ncbi:hypothetical protein GmHk_18G052581 [Glycine max]|nr:hypothetical protein GmHk_18G052581 [Glycine max]
MAEKTKKRLEEAAQSGNTEGVIDPPSPIRRHVKWKMARTKKTGQMTFEAPKEIADRIDVLTATIGRPEHPGRVRVAGVGVTIKQYFGSPSRTSRSSSDISLEDLQQLTQQIRDQLEESITEKMQSQGLALPPEPEIGPLGPRVSTKESCVALSGNDSGTSDSEKCGLYIEENLSRLVALGRLYEGSTTVHNIPLLHGQVKVCVEEVKDAEALVPVSTDDVTLLENMLSTSVFQPMLKVPTLIVLSLTSGIALPPEPEVGPSGPRVSTRESCVAPSGNDPRTGDSDKCGLYIEENPSRLVALGRLYEGSTTVHNIPLLHGQVKVGVEEVKDTEALVPVPTDEVTLVGQALNTFLAWPTHLVKRLSEQAAVSPAKPPESPDEEVDDPLYLMTLTIS